MDLSYAQHLEDYHLSRVFGTQTKGFYIDVGAGHPVADNVSCWFYLRGWRGIVVEPQTALCDLYKQIRPRDMRENCVLGRDNGEAEFHAVERLHGFSTMVTKFAEKAADFGAGYQTRRVPMKTLASLCEKHQVGEIDFLKIDVEGAEGEVLSGNDWTRWRPKVILCEAVAPGDMAPSWQEWEPILLAHAYECVLDDRLNRFYVAREQAEILAAFPRHEADWNIVPHLGHTNRAPFRTDHPDHAFAKALTGAFFARLPFLDHAVILNLLLQGESADPAGLLHAEDQTRIIDRLFPQGEARQGLDSLRAATIQDFYSRLIATDQFRVMLGRIAMSWDGGQILDGESDTPGL